MAAAVSGRVFATELVGEVADAGPDALVEAFDEARASPARRARQGPLVS